MATKPVKKHHDDRPDCAATLRRVIWQHHVKPRVWSLAELVAEMQAVRDGMGLPPLAGGAPSSLIQARMAGAKARKKGVPLHYEPETGADGKIKSRWAPSSKVKPDWRFISAADHDQIRLIARRGHLGRAVHADDSGVSKFTFSTQGHHLPDLLCIYGPVKAVRKQVGLEGMSTARGLYLLRKGEDNYVGQTKEFTTRARHHDKSGAEFVFFAVPMGDPLPISSDVLAVAESLALVSLSELFQISNATLGADTEPHKFDLRGGAAFALTFVAAVVRWAAEHPARQGELIRWRDGDVKGLAEGYLNGIAPVPPPTAA